MPQARRSAANTVLSAIDAMNEDNYGVQQPSLKGRLLTPRFKKHHSKGATDIDKKNMSVTFSVPTALVQQSRQLRQKVDRISMDQIKSAKAFSQLDDEFDDAVSLAFTIRRDLKNRSVGKQKHLTEGVRTVRRQIA